MSVAQLTRTEPMPQVLSVHPGTMRIRAVISTIHPDRAGDVVVPTGLCNRREYLQNPVVLWAHERRTLPPIGQCEQLDIFPDRIVAQTRFAQGVAFAEEVFRLFEQGVLRGWSIGFVPRRAYVLPMSRSATGTARKGLRIEEWELLEYSAVPVPENPEALTVAIQKGHIRDPQLRDWFGQYQASADHSTPHRSQGRATFDVLADLLAPMSLPPGR